MTTQLRSILERALEEQGLSVRLDRRLPAQLWDEAVGAGIARHARPTVLVAGVLHVLVADHRWRDQLDAMRTMLIARLNERLGRPLVRNLQFGLAHAGALEAPAWHQPAPAARGLLATEGALVPAADRLPPELREALLRAAWAAQARQARQPRQALQALQVLQVLKERV